MITVHNIVLLVPIVIISLYLTKLLRNHAKNSYRKSIIYAIDNDTKLQEIIKERFGWK